MKVNLLKFLCLVGVILVFVGCSKDGIATLIIVNQSNETIVLVQVVVNENIETVKHLEHGKEVEIQFSVKRDGGYDLDVEFQSGRKVTKKLGYVSYGFDAIDMITITKQDVKFERLSIDMHQ